MSDQIAVSSGRTAEIGRLWHACIGAVIALALVTQFVLVLTSDGPDIAFRLANLVSYFTIQSNILLCAASLLLAVRPFRREGSLWQVARLDSVICMTVTGVVYITILRGLEELSGLRVMTDAVFHYIAPLAAVAGWLLLGPRPMFRPRTLGYALIFPIAWCAYTLVRGEIVDWYPYPFIDASEHGYGAVAINIVLVALLLVAVGAAYVVADARLRPAPVPAAEPTPQTAREPTSEKDS